MTNAELRKALAAAELHASRVRYNLIALNKRIDALRERYTVAHVALRHYGGHDHNCTLMLDDYGDHEPLGCSCGFEAALRTTAR